MREIGSHFHILKSQLESLSADASRTPSIEPPVDDKRYLSTGRQAIRFCLQDMAVSRKQALLPGYTCHSVIQPFVQEGFKISFYPVDKKMETSISAINKLCRTHRADLVLFHPYFGFDTIHEDAPLLDGVYSIHDATQSYCSGIHYPWADYVISSIRKWGPFPDGAFCGKLKGRFRNCEDLPADEELSRLLKEACDLKAQYIEEGRGDKAGFLQAYSEAFGLLDSRDRIYQMDDSSMNLYFAYDFQEMISRRKANYGTILSYPNWQAVGKPVFDLPAGAEVPLYFPFYVSENERGRLQTYLAQRAIYAPVIWPVPAIPQGTARPPAADWIYRKILALPIDQRYEEEDMMRIRQALDGFPASREALAD